MGSRARIGRSGEVRKISPTPAPAVFGGAAAPRTCAGLPGAAESGQRLPPFLKGFFAGIADVAPHGSFRSALPENKAQEKEDFLRIFLKKHLTKQTECDIITHVQNTRQYSGIAKR